MKQKTSSHPFKHTRMDLGKTLDHNDLKQGLLLLLFLLGIIMDFFYFKTQKLLGFSVEWYFRLAIALPLLIIAILIAKQSMAVIYYELRTPPIVVEKGPFRFSRHPMYLSALLLYCSVIVASSSIIGVIIFCFICTFYAISARVEEKDLMMKFQDEYPKYQEKVHRWLDFRRIIK